MKRNYILIGVMCLVLAGSLWWTSTARAAPQATYELVKSSIGPGGSGSAGIYNLASSIGQPAAGQVSAGIYTLGIGFWGGGVIVPATTQHAVYLPLVLK